MNLVKIDEAIENVCDQLSNLTERTLPACTYIEECNKTGTTAAELGNALAALMSARKLYETDKPGRKGDSDEKEE